MFRAKKQIKENNNMTTKKMAASIIAIMMVAAIFVTTAAAFTAPNANDDRVEFEYGAGDCDGLYVNMRNCSYPDDPNAIMDTPTLRIYGESSYDAAFPYTDPEAPFNPTKDEAPEKDFVIFNPAYIVEYGYNGVIAISGSNGREKVFAKQWYVPEYPEPRGDVWTQQDTVYSADIVTEYSFMLLNAQNMPASGTAQQSGTGAYWTNFWLPIGSDGAQIGLDSFAIEPVGTNRMVQLKAVGDFNGDNLKDIDITTQDTLLISDIGWFQFLDHAIHVTDITHDGQGNSIAVVDLYYIGNRNVNEVTTADRIVANLHLDVGGQQVIAGRHTHIVGADPSFTLPWYLEVESISEQGTYLKVGRLLHMGETFFVDGAEYDIAMIYGPNDDDFKYITIRNPTPKLEDVWLDDLSINKEHVPRCTVLPMLPPFNMAHTMVDDINLPDCYTGCSIDEVCDLTSDDGTDLLDRTFAVSPLEVMWAKEAIEPRFHTNLLEILKEQTPEIWQWIHIHIMPDHYTEMIYPQLPDAAVCNYPPVSLRGDFLLVSSWEAPNSCDDRMKFAYDALDSTDIYVNEQTTCGVNSVRIYGEESHDAAFPYTDPEGPFNKLSVDAPRKDFVTFNPAYIDEYDYNGVIAVSGDNAREKVFVRQWYVPKYPEPRGDVWTQQDTVYSADIVTEYSFMLLNAQNMPASGTAQQSGTGAYWTNFWLPIGSDGAQIGLDSFAIEPVGTNRMVQLKAVGDFNGDNLKDIDITTQDTLLISDIGWFQFLDHAIHVTDITHDGQGNSIAVVDLYYIGNRNVNEVTTADRIVANLHLDVGGQQVIAGRHTHIVGADPSFTLPWYLEVESISEQGTYLKVGRLLHMGETFFVDGAEYDIAMIYGPNDDDFKYITIRNPTPKFSDVWLDDLSILKESVRICEELPMLPPFNMMHTIVDDIGIRHKTTHCTIGDTLYDEPNGIYACADTVEERLVDDQPKFVSYFVEEINEERFRTNLLEILDEDATESWDMLCMWTLPWSYTAMVYPEVGDCACGSTGPNADFLVTTSGPKGIINPPDCPGNLNGDNVVDITDLFVVLNNWGAAGGVADINGDNVVDITDLFVVLNNWGACP